MILYKDNQNLKLLVITTVEGDQEYRRNCRFIRSIERPNGAFYRMERDCFYVEGQWHRKESGKIVFDHETQTWIIPGALRLIRGVIGVKDGVETLGMFTPNHYNNCTVKTKNGEFHCINSEILIADNFIEDIGTNIWHYKPNLKINQITLCKTIRNEVDFHVKGYNIEDNALEFEEKKQSYAKFQTLISEKSRVFGKFLGETTFGAEIETSEGNLPSSVQYRNGLVACRDGSIKSAEWVTVPLQGPKGMQTLINTAEEASKRCKIDINCSLHYHFGNIPKSREYLVALYMLAYKIQNQVFTMFPYFKTDPREFKHKNYCQKLLQMEMHPCVDFSKDGYNSYINENYVKIFMFLGDGIAPGVNVNKKRQQHPIKNKWDRKSRYYWLNLQNMLFSERETAEFRLHTATTNKTKMIAWLFICNAIVKYAENNMRKIFEGRPILFEDVLNFYQNNYPNDANAQYLSIFLINYYREQKRIFADDFLRKDYASMHHITDDKEFSFIVEEDSIV